MRLKGTYNYTLSDATGIIKVFNTKPELHRWLNETYPTETGERGKSGRKLVANQLLPSSFTIHKVRRSLSEAINI